jgi:hypothetical protein
MGLVGPQGTAGAQGDWSSAEEIKEITTTTYSVVGSDVGKLLLFSSAGSGGTISVTLNSGLGIAAGKRIDLAQTGTGKVLISGTATVNASHTKQLAYRYSAATIICTGLDTYLLVGDIAP